MMGFDCHDCHLIWREIQYDNNYMYLLHYLLVDWIQNKNYIYNAIVKSRLIEYNKLLTDLRYHLMGFL